MQQPTHFCTRRQVIRQLLPIGDDAADINDPRQSGLRGGVGDDRCRARIEVDEIRAQHRVHQIVENLLTVERSPHLFAVTDVTLDHVDLPAPWHIVELGGCAGHHPHVVTGGQQFGDQPGA